MKWAAHIPSKEFQARFVNGAAVHGDQVQIVPFEEHTHHGFGEGLIIMGISGIRHLFDMYRRAGKPVLCVDKGYVRGEGYLKVSVNDTQPTAYLDKIQRPWDRIGVLEPHIEGVKDIARENLPDRVMVFDGASEKLCQWYGLGDQHSFASRIIATIKRHTLRPVVYRPRVSANSYPIPGAFLSNVSVWNDIRRAHVVISYSGAIGWNSIVAGVPHFAFGPSVARSMSETDWRNLDTPRPVTEPERWNWMANVAYCQWNEDELLTGQAWYYIKQQVELAQALGGNAQ